MNTKFSKQFELQTLNVYTKQTLKSPSKNFNYRDMSKLFFNFQKKHLVLDSFQIFKTQFGPYLLNHLSYRPENFTQNRLRGALQRNQSKLFFNFKKWKIPILGQFSVFFMNTVLAISSKPFNL